MFLRILATAGVSAALVGLSAPTAQAQALTKVRVVADNAVIMDRPTLKGTVMSAPASGKVLEALDKEGRWYWVLLDRDAYGTRRAGWIRDDVAEIIEQGRAGFSTPLSTPAAAPKPAKPKKEDDRALRKAEQELEKARRDLEKVTPKEAQPPQ